MAGPTLGGQGSIQRWNDRGLVGHFRSQGSRLFNRLLKSGLRLLGHRYKVAVLGKPDRTRYITLAVVGVASGRTVLFSEVPSAPLARGASYLQARVLGRRVLCGKGPSVRSRLGQMPQLPSLHTVQSTCAQRNRRPPKGGGRRLRHLVTEAPSPPASLPPKAAAVGEDLEVEA